MVWRALFLLTVVIGLSVAATVYFGRDVLIAAGLIFIQAKLIFKKVALLKWPSVLLWLKTQSAAFFKVELIKKWLTTTLLPLVVGKTVLRRISSFFSSYLDKVKDSYARMMAWYGGLSTPEKVLSALIVIFATLALSVSTIGVWLILFSVQVPLWILAGFATFGRLLWISVQKGAFKAVAFLQLNWAWKGLRRLLPHQWLKRKRAFDYRVARAVIRRRRLTVRQLAARKDSLPFRTGLFLDYLFRRSRRNDHSG